MNDPIIPIVIVESPPITAPVIFKLNKTRKIPMNPIIDAATF